MKPFTVTTIMFRASGYTNNERADLQKTLEVFGPTRLRPQAMPEAGGSGELWLVLQFVGQAICSGALGEIGVDLYHRISIALKKFKAHKSQHSSIPVEVATITLSFDDLDIVIHNPSDKIIESLDVIVERARRGAAKGALKGLDISRIGIPAVERYKAWEEGKGPIEMRNDDLQYWAITTGGFYTPTYGYDSENDKLLNELLTQVPLIETQKPNQ
jgi:hypothetical protein